MITNKQIINALDNAAVVSAIATSTGFAESDVWEKISAMIESANKVRPKKPSAETLANMKLAEELADEINTRGIEMTAAQVAEFATDENGIPMSTRKVGSLLRQAAIRGLVQKSPYNWEVGHYGPLDEGFEFQPKPTRSKKKTEDEDEDEVSED